MIIIVLLSFLLSSTIFLLQNDDIIITTNYNCFCCCLLPSYVFFFLEFFIIFNCTTHYAQRWKKGRLAEDAPVACGQTRRSSACMATTRRDPAPNRLCCWSIQQSRTTEATTVASITQPWMAWLYSPSVCGRHYHIRYLQSCQGSGKSLQVELENMSAGPNMLVL